MRGLTDKTKKLSLSNRYTQLELNDLRIPIVDVKDLADPGGAIFRYMLTIYPDQTRFYCKEGSASYIHRLRENRIYYATQMLLKPLSKDTIRAYLKEAAKDLGMENYNDFGAQALRAWFATKLSNDASVNLEENMASLRHRSAAAHKNYHTRGSQSEYNKYRALGLFCHVQFC